jgi:hypothetical protein
VKVAAAVMLVAILILADEVLLRNTTPKTIASHMMSLDKFLPIIAVEPQMTIAYAHEPRSIDARLRGSTHRPARHIARRRFENARTSRRRRSIAPIDQSRLGIERG